MELAFPLLSKNSANPFYPEKRGKCPLCNFEVNNKNNGIAFISAGAVFDSGKVANASSFFTVGFHSDRPDCSHSSCVEIVDDLPFEQFDLIFCSVKCLKDFFDSIIIEIEKKQMQ